VAIVVLVLWALTAGAGLRLIFTSGLGGRPQPAEHAQPAPAEVTAHAEVTAQAQVTVPATATVPVTATVLAEQATRAEEPATRAEEPATRAEEAVPAARASKRDARRAARELHDPPTLTRNKNEPIPGMKPLMEFAHPMFGIIGLAFWLGYALIHNRTLAWIAFGLAVATICVGLAWFAVNTRAARRGTGAESGPSFSARLIVIHGSAAALTFTLAALTALIAHG
jgi:hypothetical protein